MATATVAVVGSGRQFGRAVQYCRQWGGVYNPTDRTWTIDLAKAGNAANALGLYGLRLVETGGCAHYTDDQGCPLHGELCAEAKRRGEVVR